jgi:hypothetical protein
MELAAILQSIIAFANGAIKVFEAIAMAASHLMAV